MIRYAASPMDTATVHNSSLHWRACPARRHPWKAAFAVTCIALVSLLGLTVNIPTAIIMVAVLVGTQSIFFFPSSFSIDDEGITARYPLRRARFAWSEVKRFVVVGESGFLSRRRKPSMWDTFTGMPILLPEEPAETIAAIRGHLPESLA